MIKYCETTTDEYITAVKKYDLHNNVASITKPANVIFYGPAGIGKYTQALKYLFIDSGGCGGAPATPPSTKDKKLFITFNKQEYVLKMSNLHYEIDLALLGCNSKLLWHEIFTQICEIATLRRRTNTPPPQYIICKNFHTIHSELLDIFYSYIQQQYNGICIHYILITEHVSFIPDDILNACRIVSLKRPAKSAYINLVSTPFARGTDIINIKFLKTGATFHNNTHICNKVIECLRGVPIDFSILRNQIYNILTYHLDVAECVWYIIYQLHCQCPAGDHIRAIIIRDLYTFFKQYNNNYRPIYHLEKLFLSFLLLPAAAETTTPAAATI